MSLCIDAVFHIHRIKAASEPPSITKWWFYFICSAFYYRFYCIAMICLICALHCFILLHCIALLCLCLCCIALHCFLLHCIAPFCFVFILMFWHYYLCNSHANKVLWCWQFDKLKVNWWIEMKHFLPQVSLQISFLNNPLFSPTPLP